MHQDHQLMLCFSSLRGWEGEPTSRVASLGRGDHLLLLFHFFCLFCIEGSFLYRGSVLYVAYKSGLIIFVRAPEVLFLYPFLPKVLISGYKKWHFRCPNKNSEATFKSPTSLKMMELSTCFQKKRFAWPLRSPCSPLVRLF